MIKYWKYFKYIIHHKYYVMIACFKMGLYWQGLMHDMSKFLPSEFLPYANYFYGKKENDRHKSKYFKPTTTSDAAFDYAWLLHLKRNPHHWQWWILPEDEGGLKILKMQDRYLKEMLADWHGAGQVQDRQESDLWWYQKHADRIKLYPETEIELNRMLLKYPYSAYSYKYENTHH